ncbi:ABC transporter permease, partial [Rhizobium johnstonii]
VRVAIDNQTAIAAVEIGPDFSRNIEAGAPADLQVVLDGRRSNASQIFAGYLSQIGVALTVETMSAPARLPAGVSAAR